MPAATSTARRARRDDRYDRATGGPPPAFKAPGAADFTRDPELSDPVHILRMLKRYPHLHEPLIETTTIKCETGRPRMEGDWIGPYMSYVMSGLTAVKTFRDRWASSRVWQQSGFSHVPSTSLVELRFAELEGCTAGIERVVGLLVQQALRHEPRIGIYTHADGSGCATNAQAVHDCPDRKECNQRRLRVPAELTRANADEVAAARHHESGLAEDEEDAETRRVRWLNPDDERLAGHSKWKREHYRWFTQHGHLYRVADLTAGARAYQSQGRGKRKTTKFNIGAHLLVVTDDVFQAPLAVHCQPANEQEWEHYPVLEEKVHAAVGKHPLAMVVDRGFHVRSVFEHNQRRRMSTICEWRKPGHDILPEHLECEQFDRHGVVRCKHCGDVCTAIGPGLGIQFDQRDNPYLRCRCQGQTTDACKKPQRIRCDVEPRLIQPINRTHKVFGDLLEAHKNKEGHFMTARQRYMIAGTDYADRIKRRAIVPAQQLRATVGMLLDWLRICLKHEYLGSARTRPLDARERQSGRGYWRAIMRIRDEAGLWLPYGRRAHELGLAPDASIPSQRAGP